MPTLLTRDQKERVLEREEVHRPPLPPARPRFVRWVEWLGGLFLLVAAIVAVVWVANLEDAEEVVFEDDGVSELTIGPVQTDPNYVAPDLWIGANLDGTLEELEEARLAPPIALPGELGPVYVVSDFVAPTEPAPEYWVGLTLGVADEVAARQLAAAGFQSAPEEGHRLAPGIGIR